MPLPYASHSRQSTQMFILLLLIPFILLFLIFRKRDACWRSEALSAAVVWGLLLTAITEFLSIFTLLTFGWLLGLWGSVSIVLYSVYALFMKRAKPIVPLKPAKTPLSSFSGIRLRRDTH